MTPAAACPGLIVDAACARRGGTPASVRVALHAMGTRFELVLGGEDAAFLRGAGEEALREIQRWHDMLTCFGGGSVVSRVNSLAHEGAVRVGPEVMGLLLDCREVWRASDGAFDVTAGPLMHAWGFREPPLSPEEARARVGMELLDLDERACTVRFTRPGMRLDLGGVGKGAALDSAIETLRGLGVGRAFLHGGTSSVGTIGEWSVALASPPGSGLAPALVRLTDQSLSVSAPHGRRGTGGKGHVMDPRTGTPVRAAATAAVVAPAGVAAEAWSTALLVLGERPCAMAGGFVTYLARGGAWRVEGGES